MLGLREDKILKYLAILKEVKESCITYDIHLHPIEIILNILDYKEDQKRKGLFTLGNTKYSRPTPKGLGILFGEQDENAHDQQSAPIMDFFLRKAYLYTGPMVFRDIFELTGIEKGLLLPVAPEKGSVEEQMDLSFKMYSGDNHFYLAGSISNIIPNHEIGIYLRAQVKKYGIVAVKIHPNIMGIDLTDARGKERLEGIINVCAELKLPLIIHGGRGWKKNNNNLKYAVLKNFEDIKLTAPIPIVIAHAGAYKYSLCEFNDEVIPVLKKLLERNENLCVDISGLKSEVISQILLNSEIERILFGSDALYENQIIMLMRLAHALETAGKKMEESLTKILSENIRKRLFPWENKNI